MTTALLRPRSNKRVYQDFLPRKVKIKRLLWCVVYALFFRPTLRVGMNTWRVWLLRRFGASIGNGCKIHPTAKVWLPSNLFLGDYVCVASETDIYCVNLIKICSFSTVSQRSFLCTASHDISHLSRPLISKAITLGEHSWICAEAFIGPGVVIGEGSVVAARAVVTKDVASWTVVAGNPASFIKDRVLRDDGGDSP